MTTPIWWVSAYFIVLILIGLYSTRISAKTTDDYFVANRGLGIMAILFSTLYAGWSAFLFMGYPGNIYKFGMGQNVMIIYAVVAPFIIVTIGEKMRVMGAKRSWVTPADLLYDRYDSKPYRLIVSLIIIVFMLPYIGIQVIGCGLALSASTKGLLSYEAAAVFVLSIMMIYLLIGGMRSAAWTSVAQGILFTAAVVIAVFWLPYAVYGSAFGGIIQSINDTLAKMPKTLTLPGEKGFFVFHWGYLHMILFGLTFYIAQPHVFRNFYMAKSKVTMYWTAVLVPLVTFGTYGLLTTLGYELTGIMGPGIKDPDQGVFIMVTKYLPPWFVGVFIIGLFSAAMSTVSQQIMLCIASISKDIWKGFVNPQASDKTLLVVSKVGLIVVFVISLAIAFIKPAGIIMIVTSLSTPGFMMITPQLIMGMYWERSTTAGAIAGTCLGLAAVLFTTYVTPWPFKLSPIFWGLLVNIPVHVAVSYMSRKPSEAIVNMFHKEEYLKDAA